MQTRNDMTSQLMMHVQIYYSMDVLTGEDFDEISIEEQRKILPDLLAWYSPTWFARTFPHVEDELPDGVKPSKHFISFDRENGLTLCIEYMISESIVLDTEKFKKVLKSITDDAEGQFSDGWGESLEQRSFKIGDREYYLRTTSDIFWIVTNIRFAESLLVRWKSISEIEHTEWMLSHLNAYSDSLFSLSREKEVAGVRMNDEMLKFVEANREKFFVAR